MPPLLHHIGHRNSNAHASSPTTAAPVCQTNTSSMKYIRGAPVLWLGGWLIQIVNDFARTPVVGNTEPLSGTWAHELVGFSAAPSVFSEKRLTLNATKARLRAAECSISREDVPADWIHHPFAFGSLSASKSGLAPLAVGVLKHSLQDRGQMAEYARASAEAADEANITIRVINHPAKGPAPPGKVFPPFCIIFFLPQMTTNSHLAYPRTSAVRGA